nr:immunoglobulin heavy chain junction region [Mus musculus]
CARRGGWLLFPYW